MFKKLHTLDGLLGRLYNVHCTCLHSTMYNVHCTCLHSTCTHQRGQSFIEGKRVKPQHNVWRLMDQGCETSLASLVLTPSNMD